MAGHSRPLEQCGFWLILHWIGSWGPGMDYEVLAPELVARGSVNFAVELFAPSGPECVCFGRGAKARSVLKRFSIDLPRRVPPSSDCGPASNIVPAKASRAATGTCFSGHCCHTNKKDYTIGDQLILGASSRAPWDAPRSDRAWRGNRNQFPAGASG